MKIKYIYFLLLILGVYFSDARFRDHGKRKQIINNILATNMDLPEIATPGEKAELSQTPTEQLPSAETADAVPEQALPELSAMPTDHIAPMVNIESLPIPVPAEQQLIENEKKLTAAQVMAESANNTDHRATDAIADKAVQELIKKGNVGFDIEKKQKQVIAYVDRAVAYFNQHSLDECCYEFIRGKSFVEGDLSIFLYDFQGNTYVNGADPDLIWYNLWNFKDQFNTYIVQELIKAAKSSNKNWITYHWNGATKVSYVQEVEKNGKSYVIGAGYYPHSKDDQVVALVKGAVTLFNELVNKQGYPPEEAFSSYSYPLGRFVFGDLYIYALDFNGRQVAHGLQPGLIGTNGWNYQDAKGKYVNQEIIKKLKETNAGVWVEYESKRAPKLAYAEKVIDQKTKTEYFVACGYHPTVTPSQAVDLVKRGYEYMKRQGRSRAVEAFSSKREDTFRYGDLALFVYDMKGICIADGWNATLIGSNQWNWKDEGGVFYIQEIIHKAKEGGGWVNVKLRNSFESAYLEPIELGLEKYVIVTALFPVSKKETALLLVKGAVSILKAYSEIEAMRFFAQKGSFIRGDLGITVYDSEGICLVDGKNHNNIWLNMLDAKDDHGKPYVRLLINEVKRGPVQLTYTIRGAQRLVFAEQVQKQDKTYIVVCGYYI